MSILNKRSWFSLDSPGSLVPESLFKRQSLSPYGVRAPEGLWWTGGSEKLKGD